MDKQTISKEGIALIKELLTIQDPIVFSELHRLIHEWIKRNET